MLGAKVVGPGDLAKQAAQWALATQGGIMAWPYMRAKRPNTIDQARRN